MHLANVFFVDAKGANIACHNYNNLIAAANLMLIKATWVASHYDDFQIHTCLAYLKVNDRNPTPT